MTDRGENRHPPATGHGEDRPAQGGQPNGTWAHRSVASALPTTRRTFVALGVGLSIAGAGTGIVAGSEDDATEPTGFGEGGFGGTAVDPAPHVGDYAGDDDIITTDGLRDAVDDWRAGEISTDLLRDVVDAWRTGDPVS